MKQALQALLETHWQMMQAMVGVDMYTKIKPYEEHEDIEPLLCTFKMTMIMQDIPED